MVKCKILENNKLNKYDVAPLTMMNVLSGKLEQPKVVFVMETEFLPGPGKCWDCFSRGPAHGEDRD